MNILLQDVEVEILTNEACNTQYGYPDGSITDSMMCAGVAEGGKDSCQGDSGGPLVVTEVTEEDEIKAELVGIVSWGKDCADKDYPGVYSRVTANLDWVLAVTSEGKTCPRSDNDTTEFKGAK